MNAEQKQRAIKLITYWRNRSITTMPEEHFVSGDCMTDLLQELIDAPEPEPFGYFKAEPFGWTDCSETDEGAIALYTAPPAQSVPDGWREIIEAVLREIPAGKGVNGNAPGHSHRIAGILDDDNGPLSGKPCAWIMTWNKAKAMLEAAPERNPELVRDAERYRWLRTYNTAKHPSVTEAFFLGDENLDAEIDAAIAAEKGGA